MPPTDKMIAFAQRLAKEKNSCLPRGYNMDFNICRSLIYQQLKR